MTNSILIMIFCLFMGRSYQKDLIGKYKIPNRNIFFEIIKKQDSIYYGTHSFITRNGDRIDFCCVDTNKFSLKLKRINQKEYAGSLESTYDYGKHNIQIEMRKGCIILYFIDHSHPFLSDTLVFEKSEEKL